MVPNTSRASRDGSTPPSPCWWCDGEHWSNTCPPKEERRRNKQCIRCGSDKHWIKACPEFNKIEEDPARGVGKLTVWCMRCATTDHSTVTCKSTDPAINMPESEDEVRGCKWCGVRRHDWEECFKRLPVAQRKLGEKLSATTSGLDSALDRMEALELRQAKTDEAVASIKDIDADISTIKGQVERLLSWKSDAEKRMRDNEEKLTGFDLALKKHAQAHLKTGTTVMHHQSALTAFDKALIAAKIIPQSALPGKSLTHDATDVDALSQRTTPPRESRQKRDGASSSSATVSPDTRPKKKRPGSADTEWYMALQPVTGVPADLWPDALMDELLVDWSPKQAERLENWLKEWSTEEMLSTLLSLNNVSTNTRNRGLKTILHGSRIPPKCFASRPAVSA